jgi:hypothetical protein
MDARLFLLGSDGVVEAYLAFAGQRASPPADTDAALLRLLQEMRRDLGEAPLGSLPAPLSRILLSNNGHDARARESEG